MQIEFAHANMQRSACMLVHHKDETVEFNGQAFVRIFKKGTFEPFIQLNKYWERLSKSDQDRIFSLYRQARLICADVTTVRGLIVALRPLVSELLEFHDTEQFDRFVRHQADIRVPADFDEEFKQDFRRARTREQTYVVGDYWDLVTMLAKLRTIAPIWGEFVEITRRDSGNFVEMNAYYLIKNTVVDTCAAMTRLREYVAKTLKKDDYTARSAVEGIGSADFQTNHIANVLVRYICLANLVQEPGDMHLVQIIHKTLKNRISQNDSHQNKIQDKRPPKDEDGGSEDSSSIVEKYKYKPQVAPGTFVAIEKDTEYMDRIASRLLLKDSLSRAERSELKDSLESAKLVGAVAFENCQISMMQIVVSPIISARAHWDIEHSAIQRIAAITEFVLWNTGFKDLAGIATGRSLSGDHETNFGTESRSHIPKEITERLDELYPFQKKHPFKKSNKNTNDALVQIHALAGELSDYSWYLNLTDEKLKEIRGSAANKTYRVGHDIRVRLAQLVIHIQERNANYIPMFQF